MANELNIGELVSTPFGISPPMDELLGEPVKARRCRCGQWCEPGFAVCSEECLLDWDAMAENACLRGECFGGK